MFVTLSIFFFVFLFVLYDLICHLALVIILPLMDEFDTSYIEPALPLGKKKKITMDRVESELYLFNEARRCEYNNVVNRQLSDSCVDLDNFDRTAEIYGDRGFKLPDNKLRACYGCSAHVNKFHPNYTFSCHRCGTIFQKMRHFSTPLGGRVSVVIGCRTKLGHQVVLKLLRAGSIVVGSTRRPQAAKQLFSGYHDADDILQRLFIYPHALNLDTNNIALEIGNVVTFVETQFGVLDNLVICAAQTIRVREKGVNFCTELNRYGDSRYFDSDLLNSWNMTLEDLMQDEMEEVFRVNAIAPCLIVQQFLPLLKKSTQVPYIINVHAREGLLHVKKNAKHMHTNMAKAALAMLTKCLVSAKLTTSKGEAFSIHGCDPGWISMDEYHKFPRPWIVAPLDEVDGAARVLSPIFRNLQSCSLTRRHFFNHAS